MKSTYPVAAVVSIQSSWPPEDDHDNDEDDEDGYRVRKSKNFPDSKIFHVKTFRIKRVNCDTFAFATKVRKTREFHVFLANVHNVELDGG